VSLVRAGTLEEILDEWLSKSESLGWAHRSPLPDHASTVSWPPALPYRKPTFTRWSSAGQRRAAFSAPRATNPAGKVDHFPIGVDGFDKEAINNNGLPSGGVQRRAGSPKRA